MPDPRDPKLLFCPFCGRGFEDRGECPEHELTLLSIDELQASSAKPVTRVTFFADPRLGRGLVLVGAFSILVGFLLPFARSGGRAFSALEIAIDGAANLWLVPAVGIGLGWICWRRRTRQSMYAARVAVFALAIGGMLPHVYTIRRITWMADAAGSSVQWLLGPWVIAAGLLASAVGSLRFGGRIEPATRRRPRSG